MSEVQRNSWLGPNEMQAADVLHDAAVQLNKDAGDDWVVLPLPNDMEVAVSGMERMVRLAVLDLLERNPAHLASLFYRFDLNERKVNQAFAAGLPDAIADALAVLMLRRSLQKVLYRRIYKPRV